MRICQLNNMQRVYLSQKKKKYIDIDNNPTSQSIVVIQKKPMQELLHMEEVEINAHKKRTKFKFDFKKTSNPLCPDF